MAYILNAYQIRKDYDLDIKSYKELSSKLKRCFDLENKLDRSFEESINLIEYCMNFYEIE